MKVIRQITYVLQISLVPEHYAIVERSLEHLSHCTASTYVHCSVVPRFWGEQTIGEKKKGTDGKTAL